MPRGFKKQLSEGMPVRLAWFQDEGSFISQPKAIKGECDEPRAHLLLEGVDKGPIRAEIFRRNREANAGVNRCWNCRREVFEIKNCNDDGPYAGEWHHLRNQSGSRCDCPENGVVSCRPCHRQSHSQPWRKIEIARAH